MSIKDLKDFPLITLDASFKSQVGHGEYYNVILLLNDPTLLMTILTIINCRFFTEKDRYKNNFSTTIKNSGNAGLRTDTSIFTNYIIRRNYKKLPL